MILAIVSAAIVAFIIYTLTLGKIREIAVLKLIGPSGSGMSTLLKCLGAVIEPTADRMTLGEEVIYDDGWKMADLHALRRDKIGFVFQAPYLIPFLDEKIIPTFKRIYHIRDGKTKEEAGEGRAIE